MPWTQAGLPWNGRSQASRHTSYSGAQAAARSRGEKTRQYLELLRRLGPLTDHEAAALLRIGLSSVNSIRNNVKDVLQPDAMVPGLCGARRTKWRLGRRVRIVSAEQRLW